jgi:hypothetical protein
LLDSYKPNTGDLEGKLPLRYDFGVSFEVVIPEREDWDYVPSEQEAIVYYKDGSRIDG